MCLRSTTQAPFGCSPSSYGLDVRTKGGDYHVCLSVSSPPWSPDPSNLSQNRLLSTVDLFFFTVCGKNLPFMRDRDRHRTNPPRRRRTIGRNPRPIRQPHIPSFPDPVLDGGSGPDGTRKTHWNPFSEERGPEARYRSLPFPPFSPLRPPTYL